VQPGPLPDVTITGVVADSRQVKPGNLFVAVAGGSADGHRFITDALRGGAAAVVGTRPDTHDLPVPYIQVDDSRRLLAHLAAGFYDFPARKLTVIGVTGTDGKTTTSNLIYHILKSSGLQAGMISTVNAVVGDEILDTGFHVTTPDAPDVQRYLAQMVDKGLTHVVLEVTSHGLAQNRVDACEFDVAVVTNITHEHLDYHGSYEAYRAAKALLFEELAKTQPKDFPAPRAGVLNRDDSSYDYLSELMIVPELSYGMHPSADVRAVDIRHTPEGLRFTALGPGFEIPIRSSLAGDFNVSNCLAAITVMASAVGLDLERVRAGIEAMPGVPGRMERLDLGQDFTAIVDFAHTPNALRVALQTARQMAGSHPENGRVIAVFGSAGLRDRQKRRMMAEVSAELADITILTAEDPRTESLTGILAEMAEGAVSRGGVEGKTFWREPDRPSALRLAVAMAREGDVVISCGKGHEQSMCFEAVEYPWDDRIALSAALSERLSIPGPQMPYLPTQRGNFS